MEENPYLTLLQVMRGQARETWPAGLTFGQVKSWPSSSQPDREHQVVVADTIQERADLYRNAGLGEYGLAAGGPGAPAAGGGRAEVSNRM